MESIGISEATWFYALSTTPTPSNFWLEANQHFQKERVEIPKCHVFQPLRLFLQLPSREERSFRREIGMRTLHIFLFQQQVFKCWLRKEMKTEPVLTNYCLSKWQAWHTLDGFFLSTIRCSMSFQPGTGCCCWAVESLTQPWLQNKDSRCRQALPAALFNANTQG